MKSFAKKTAAVCAACALALSLCGCAAVQQGMNTLGTEMNGAQRTVAVYGVGGEEIARFDCRCTIDYEDGRVLFDNLDTNERTVVYGQCAVVIATEVE